MTDRTDRFSIETIVRPHPEAQGADGHLELLTKLIKIRRLDNLLHHYLLFRLNGDPDLGVLDKGVEMLAENLRCLNKSHLRPQSAIGPDLQDQAIIVGQLSDPGILGFIPNPADRRERGIHPDDPDLIVPIAVLRSGIVTAPLARLQIDVEGNILGELRDVELRVDDGNLGAMLNIPRGNVTRLVDTDLEIHLVNSALDLHVHIFEIQHYDRNILVNACHAGEFMLNSFYLGVDKRRSLERGKEYSSQAVAHSNTEPTFKRLYEKPAISGFPRFLFANN